MYAVIAHSGRQYRVSEGDIIDLDRIRVNVGEPVVFDRILLVRNEVLKIGRPYLTGFRVIGRVLKHYRGKKILVFKYKRRKGYRRKKGFRPELTSVRIEKIEEVGNGS